MTENQILKSFVEYLVVDLFCNGNVGVKARFTAF